jgi:dTDP-4-dehydrorhamnose reductase
VKVVILGGTGMLGQAVANEFLEFDGSVSITSRQESLNGFPNPLVPVKFDAKTDVAFESLQGLAEGDFIINCIGIIKSEIVEADPDSVEQAIEVNTRFPKRLAQFAEANGVKVIQIATDCVFSGKRGSYLETDIHDPVDLYGSTKSAGEVVSTAMMHLRVSIIGRERRGFTSLYEWVARQPLGAQVTGYINHDWNGIPAKHFGKISKAIIQNDLFESGMHHVLPSDAVSKAQLVRLIAEHEGRKD